MIIPIYKPIGASTHQLAHKYGFLIQQKATHTGTLDPMASGVVVILTGKDRFHKSTLSKFKKSYDFELLLGVSTDTHDALGLIKNHRNLDNKKFLHLIQEVEAKSQELKGSFYQKQPFFSAQRHKGKSYFDYAKKNLKLPEKKNLVHIYEIRLIEQKIIKNEQLKLSIYQNINKVRGNFRQKEIIDGWEKYFLKSRFQTHLIVKMNAQTSHRCFIRSITQSISQKIKVPALTLKINRVKNGPFSIKDCICLL